MIISKPLAFRSNLYYLYGTNLIKMTKIFLFITIAMTSIMLSVSSCSKEQIVSATQPTLKQGIEFTYDGYYKQYFKVNAAKVETSSGNIYSFVATKIPEAENYFNIILRTDSLVPGKYIITESGNSISFREGNVIANNCVYGPVTVTITSNSNGFVSGSFEGLVYDYETHNMKKLSSGKLENVKIIYQ